MYFCLRLQTLQLQAQFFCLYLQHQAECLPIFISISRAGDVTGNPNLKVKVLSGSYNIKIKAKTEADGKCRVYAERLVYTPILNVLLMSSFGISMKMEAADNSAFEGGFEATLE